MVERFHVDTDFLVHALTHTGSERTRLQQIADSDAVVEISAIAWYEFCRGPRTVDQIAVARSFFGDQGVIPFDEGLADKAADQFRRLGRPRKRAADLAIGVSAVVREAILLTRNGTDFAGIDDLRLEITTAAKERSSSKQSGPSRG